MRTAGGIGSAALALAVLLGGGHAGAADQGDILREPTGPKAGPLPLPPFAAPPAPPLASPPAQITEPNGGATRRLVLNGVRVTVHAPARGRTSPARPRHGWKAGRAGAGDLRIEIRHGEALGPAWVRRQFQLNGLIGQPTSADRVVSLVLLINQAFVQNGYINTGLRFGEHDWPTADGGIDLWLIEGAITPLRSGRPTVDVLWKTETAGAAKPRAARRRRNPITGFLAAAQDFGHAKGSGGLRKKYVRDRMPSAKRSPLNLVDLERDFRRLSDDPALRTVNANLVPAVRAEAPHAPLPGEALLSLTVVPAPRLDVYASVASSRTPSIGGIRYSGGASFRNLLLSGDQIILEGGETAGLVDGSVDYSTPFLWRGSRLGLRATMDQAAVLDKSVLALGIRSSDRALEASLRQRLIDQPLTPPSGDQGWKPAQTLEIAVRFTTRHSQSSLDGVPFSFSPGSVNGVTNITEAHGEVYYVRRNENSVLATSMVATLGLSGTGSDLPGVIKPSPNFQAVLVQTSFLRRLPSLLASGVEFKATLDAQWSGGTLYSSEAFSAGGDTVRGYRQNDLLADEGVRGSLELYCPIGFGHGLCDARATDWKSVRLSVFTDGAYLHNHQGAQPRPPGIASLGVALGWQPTRSVLAQVSYGPLKLHEPRTGALDIQDRGIQFSLTFHPLAPFAPD